MFGMFPPCSSSSTNPLKITWSASLHGTGLGHITAIIDGSMLFLCELMFSGAAKAKLAKRRQWNQ